MLMISREQAVLRSALRDIPTPEGTSSWSPISHWELCETVAERASARGLRIKSEKYSLADGTLYPRPGVQVALRGARFYGSIDFEPIKGLVFPPDCTPSCGLVNSNDKSRSLSIISGGHVIVCGNGLMIGEFQVHRRHTSGIDLRQAVDVALGEFLNSLTEFQSTYDRLRNWKLRKDTAQSLICDFARAGAFASSDIIPILEEYDKPSYADAQFNERTAWAAFNACTSIMKSQRPSRQIVGFKAMNSVLLPHLN